MDRSRLGPLLCAAALPLSCVREPLTGACPELVAGELVLTEIRGPQAGSYREWLELYNASDRPLALGGLSIAFVPFDGGASTRLLVRDAELVVEPGAYVVLGGGEPDRFDYIDYDYTGDFHSAPSDDDGDGVISDDERYPLQPRSLPGSGFFEIGGCGELFDRVRVDLLPTEGTLFWPGEPDAGGNDQAAAWCVDDFTVSNTGTGARGTPGEANPPCP